MASGAVTSYPRHNSYHGAPPPRASLGRFRYTSDPTLLETGRDDGQNKQKRSTSVQDDYSLSEENLNTVRQAKKAKKKKLKRLKSFVHVFLGGLRRRHTIHGEQDVIAMTRFQQRDERDGLATEGLRREGQAGTTSPTHAPGGEVSRSGSNPLLPRLPNHIPGLCGLYNHGNTCFMNAVLQCLSNTDQLAEYFVTDHYKNDMNGHRPVRNFGTAGDVTEQLALLLKCLWNGQYDPRVTSIFKDVVGKHANQYQGTSQHDAQEFFLWLLDSVHEDLNQAGRKKYRPIKDSKGRPDEEVAAETLASHLKSNNSFVQNLFQGQFCSTLLCPSCGFRSCTFDPYVCVSLPLPQREMRPVYVTMVYRSASRRMRVFGVNVPINATVRDLRNQFAELCGVNRHHLVLCDLLPGGFHRTFYDDQHISVVHAHDLVCAFECPPYRGDNPEAHTPANPSGSKELILILVVNKFGQTQYGKRFGPPLILRIWRDLTHFQFQSVILKAMSRYIREGVQLADVCRSSNLFRCRVADGHPGRCILPVEAEHPFYSPSVDKAVSVSMLYGGPAHIKIIAEWDPETKASVFGVLQDEIPEPHESVPRLRQIYQQPLEASLDECLQIYTHEETLNREDSWYCTHCKQQQQDATKKITLWTLPDVLVVHLKRFRQLGYCRTKLSTLVKFPITGLDMTPYITSRNSTPTRPASAQDLRERIQVSRSARTLPSKSVRFEDESSSPTKAGKSRSGRHGFHFPWRKKSKKGRGKENEERCASPDPGTFTPSVTDSPMSVRSAPSVIGHSIGHHRSRHASGSPPPDDIDFHQSLSSLGESRLDNIYDLYAVCNHHGSMSRGHYTAYCRNPADGNWYVFDDQQIQPVTEEQLITPGAYMLFYVRQNLLVQSPLSSSESSASSGGSSTNHWIYHIPQFTLDLGSLSEESIDSRSGQPSHARQQHSRQRLGSANSAVSAPPTTGAQISPPSSAHDNDSEVFAASVITTASSSQGHPRQDARSAVSLPPYTPRQPGPRSPSHHPPGLESPSRVPRRQTSYPAPPSYDQAVLASPIHNRMVKGRHPSLRLGRSHQTNPSREEERDSFKRGRSFHSPRHNVVQRSDTLPGHYGNEQQQSVLPSRSIPNVSVPQFSPTLPHRVFSAEVEDGFFTQPRQRSASYSSRSQRLTTPKATHSHHVSHV